MDKTQSDENLIEKKKKKRKNPSVPPQDPVQYFFVLYFGERSGKRILLFLFHHRVLFVTLPRI